MKYFFIALQFLTRLKIVNQTEWSSEAFGKSVTYFTAVGYVIGLLSAIVYLLFYPLFSYQLTALIVVIFQFLLTGGLHADGYMDTCDGLFSGRDRERKLEIMKDSRVGSNGVIGFIFLVLLKWQLISIIPFHTTPFILLLLSPISKQGLVMSIRKFPYARPEGMGKAFAALSPSNSVLVNSVCLVLGSLIISYYVSVIFMIVVAFILFLAWLVNTIINKYVVKHLGGVTGDTYGFVSECTEVLILFMFVLIFRLMVVYF